MPSPAFLLEKYARDVCSNNKPELRTIGMRGHDARVGEVLSFLVGSKLIFEYLVECRTEFPSVLAAIEHYGCERLMPEALDQRDCLLRYYKLTLPSKKKGSATLEKAVEWNRRIGPAAALEGRGLHCTRT